LLGPLPTGDISDAPPARGLQRVLAGLGASSSYRALKQEGWAHEARVGRTTVQRLERGEGDVLPAIEVAIVKAFAEPGSSLSTVTSQAYGCKPRNGRRLSEVGLAHDNRLLVIGVNDDLRSHRCQLTGRDALIDRRPARLA
jgi:hypothetical protein